MYFGVIIKLASVSKVECLQLERSGGTSHKLEGQEHYNWTVNNPTNRQFASCSLFFFSYFFYI